MNFKKLIAGVVVTAVSVTTLAAPAEKSFSGMLKPDYMLTAEAADKTIETDYTLVASTSTKDPAPNRARIPLPADTKNVTLHCETTSTDEVTIGIFGAELTEAPWWGDITDQIKTQATDGKIDYEFAIPDDIQGSLKKLCVALWYPKSGVTVNITSITHDGSRIILEPDGPQEKPATENTKSGSWTFKDNEDGTATASSTLTCQTVSKAVGSKIGPGGSQKISLKSFGFEEGADIAIQSFNFKLKSKEVIDSFTYAGGISVEAGSEVETEEGWYADPTEDSRYVVKNAGTYADIVWDVPADVQKFVTFDEDSEVELQIPEAVLLNPDEDEPIDPEFTIESITCTYTQTSTFPYDKTLTQKVGVKLDNDKKTSLSYDLSKSGIGKRCYAGAIKFNFTTSVSTDEIQFGLGVSVADTKPDYAGWFMPEGGAAILEPNSKKGELMWLIPEDIMKDVYYEEGGKLEFTIWYAGEKANTITLTSIDFYEYITKEADLEVTPDEFEMLIDEEVQLDVNIEGYEIETSDETIATVSEDGVVKAVALGEAVITVKTPEGQVQEVYVNVVEEKSPETTKPVTTTKPTTTKTSSSEASKTNATSQITVTTTKTSVTGDSSETAPSETTTKATTTKTGQDKMKPGDVNVDGKVDTADLVLLNQYLVKNAKLLTLAAKENANVNKDSAVNVFDSVALRKMLLKK